MAGFNNDVLIADNVDFRGVSPTSGQVTTDGQLLIGSTVAPNIRVGTLTSTGGTLTITPGSGTINLDLAGGSVGVDSVAVQATTAPGVSPVLPTGAGLMTVNGAAVAAQTIPIQSRSIALNSYQIEAQRASSSAVTNATQQGLASFNSSQFLVDASGWVSQLNGLSPSNFPVQAVTGPGVSPVVPSALGALSISGATVAAGVVPLQSRSIAVNSLQLEVQRASSSAATNATQQGVSSYNSAQFSVDANGWVSQVNGLSASSFGVQAATGPGTNPVLPTAGGLVTINGTVVAAHAIPLRTDSLAANTINVEAQISSAQAVSTASANGLAHFSSASFAVDGNGFVTFTGSTAMSWIDQALPITLATQTGYFVTSGITVTLPAGAAQGSIIEVVNDFGASVVIQAGVGQTIRIGNVTSSVAGTATSPLQGDSIRIVYRAATSTWFAVPGVEGNWILA